MYCEKIRISQTLDHKTEMSLIWILMLSSLFILSIKQLLTKNEYKMAISYENLVVTPAPNFSSCWRSWWSTQKYKLHGISNLINNLKFSIYSGVIHVSITYISLGTWIFHKFFKKNKSLSINKLCLLGLCEWGTVHSRSISLAE